ncbi:hypothetical protein ES288_D09G255200v1 [Gossypium darwinii]|uniref:Uncharacterized protein n=1 Tax=Gossypium darwinii TaxID=34276 RepID=A0A5D2BE39_GOSDA|nr:hypothetical protein ES288_D09G255200v1 [Gossypium darwinii]
MTVMRHRFWLSIIFMVALGLGNLTDATLRFGMLPKGVPIPPSAASTYLPFPPMILTSLSLSKSLKVGMLPKGVPIPPPRPSRRTSDSPPPPPPLTSTSLSISKSLNSGMLPKGPPSPGKM